MSNTTKYILIGGAVAAAVYLVARSRMGASASADVAPSGLENKLTALTGLTDSLTKFAGTITGSPDATKNPAADMTGSTPYATMASSPDGLVPSTLDASGYRTRRSYISASELATTSQLALIGVTS